MYENWKAQKIPEEMDDLDPFQLGFRPRYRTKTALITLMDDLWQEHDGPLSGFQYHQP